VAGTIAMGRVSLNNSIITSGVAPASKIVSMKIASKQSYSVPASSSNPCGSGVSSCTILYLADVYSALDYTITLAQSHSKIAAVNMSLGAGAYSTVSDCQADFAATYATFKTATTKLKSLGIATVIANGNNGSGKNQGKIAFPACVEGAIAVGSTSVDGTHMAYYSQNGSLTTLLAPGGDGTDGLFGWMWLPENGVPNSFIGTQGTSFASPVVAGAYAVLRSKWPGMSVNEMTNLLVTTGTSFTDSRDGYGGLQKPLINISAALAKTVDSFSSSVHGVDGANIKLSRQASIRTIMNDLSTPYDFAFKNGSGEVVYQSDFTPYATSASLSHAGEVVGDDWTVETLSYPINSFSAESYDLAYQTSSSGDGSVDVIAEIERSIGMNVDVDTINLNLSPAVSGSGTNSKVEVLVETNSTGGYTLSLSTPQPSLVCQSDNSATIGALISPGNLVDDRWGFGLGTVSSAPSSWRGASVQPFIIDSYDSVTTSTPRYSYIYVGIKVSYATRACDDYQTSIILTALAQ
jgi:hypothetical protein